jgi:hypothetical protein
MPYTAIPVLADTHRVVAFWDLFSSADIYGNYVFSHGKLRSFEGLVYYPRITRTFFTQLDKTGLRAKEISATKTRWFESNIL